MGLLLLNGALLLDFAITFALIAVAGQAFDGELLPIPHDAGDSGI